MRSLLRDLEPGAGDGARGTEVPVDTLRLERHHHRHASDTGWPCLKFSLDEPQYYSYLYTAGNTSAASGNFTATANGDLNGNGVLSTFQVFGSALSGAVGISPTIAETNPEE